MSDRAASPWEAFLWPRWLPERMRMPVVAQVTAAVALTSLIIGPWWASLPKAPVAPTLAAVPRSTPVPPPAAVPQTPAVTPEGLRPAHLNLDVRHTFGSADLSVTIDGKPAFQTTLDGSGKRFKVFGKRAERGYTKTLDLPPGAHVIGVHVQSKADKFDQTRVERFELESASVAALEVSADRSGLSLVAQRPASSTAARAATPAPAPAAVAPALPAARADVLAETAQVRQEASATVDVLQSMRSTLIAIAGFVASTATAFLIQEFLRSRKLPLFARTAGGEADLAEAGERRRRRRSRNEPSV